MTMDSFFKALVRCALWLAVALCLLGGLAALLACLLPGPAPTARAAIAWAAAVWYLAFAIWISWLRRPKAQKG